MARSTTPRKRRSAADSAIRVRMYRQGLGDCFLITLPKEDGSPFYLMIDCGVILGTAKPDDMMKKVVDSIIGVTKGKVDLLVVTHEHWDHLSGFIQAQDRFATTDDRKKAGKLAVGEIWFAWTEDPSDKLANKLRKERAERVKKLAAFVGAAKKDKGLANVPAVNGVGEVLSFFGVKSGETAAPKGKSTGDALAFVRRLAKKVRYCRPSDEPSKLKGVPNIRVYVLGPPEDEALIRKTDSRKEVYRELLGAGAPTAFFAAATAQMDEMAAEGEAFEDEAERNNPFDFVYRRPLAPAPSDGSPRDTLSSFLDRYYFGRAVDPGNPDQSWRRIDADWMGAAAEFALQLDSATNNTSLALALELTDSGKVLLFVADAQVGNWLSWQDLAWNFDDQTVTGPDLLKRTVFYKVGHHGSHNATLKAKGLEMMASDDLVAFIPVNEVMAKKKNWGHMPLPSLVKQLEERSHGRIVRMDEDYKVKDSDNEKAKAFEKALTKDVLFFEWTMPLPD